MANILYKYKTVTLRKQIGACLYSSNWGFCHGFSNSQDYTDCQCNVHISTTTSYFHNAHLHIQVSSWKLSSNNTENKPPTLPIPTETAKDPLSSTMFVFDEWFGKKKKNK